LGSAIGIPIGSGRKVSAGLIGPSKGRLAKDRRRGEGAAQNDEEFEHCESGFHKRLGFDSPRRGRCHAWNLFGNRSDSSGACFHSGCGVVWFFWFYGNGTPFCFLSISKTYESKIYFE
jgi:hypothetical protein